MSSQLVTARTPATPVTPVTPVVQRQHDPTPTGKWKHPHFDEITRRQYASTFDDRNIRTIIANTGLLAISWALFNSTSRNSTFRMLQAFVLHYKETIPYASYALGAIRLLFIYNIAMAMRPLFLRYTPDEMTDIPLTPSQRKAMGLDPNASTPQTPGTAYASPNYVTPPRYQKSTPRTTAFGSSGDRHSPLSGSPRASFGVSSSHSPFSPGSGSPLFQKALGGSAQKRMSMNGRSGSFDGSFFLDSTSSGAPSTPTPGAGKASVGLNNKWLYEKRRDSRGSAMFS